MTVSKLIKYMLSGYLFSKAFCALKSFYYTMRYVDAGNGRIVVSRPFLKLYVSKSKNARIELNGNLILTSHCNARGGVYVQIGEHGLVHIKNDFSFGQNNKIHVSNNGNLIVNGSKDELVSGITCDSTIMCFNRIEIGTDLICGWNVYITDSDWHTTIKNGIPQTHHNDVTIGNHCWVGSNVIIGKGTTLGDNVVVGAYTKLSNTNIEQGSTVIGMPPKVINKTLQWSREI